VSNNPYIDDRPYQEEAYQQRLALEELKAFRDRIHHYHRRISEETLWRDIAWELKDMAEEYEHAARD